MNFGKESKSRIYELLGGGVEAAEDTQRIGLLLH